MAEKSQGRFYLEVLTGEDKGATCWLNPDSQVTIGRGETSAIQINHPEAKVEHAVVSILKNQVWLENLSSSGTLLNGRIVRERAIVLTDEIIGIGDEIKIALRSTGETKSDESSTLLISLLVLILIGGSVLLAVLTAKQHKKKSSNRPITSKHWNSAYEKLNVRLKIWSNEKRMNVAYYEEFTQAWFRDQGGDNEGALERWQNLYNGVIGLHIPGATPPGKTVASGATNNPRVLYIIMGYDSSINPNNSLEWTGDDSSFASAWWWFINKRIDSLQEKKD